MKSFFLGWTRVAVALLVLQAGLAGWGAVTEGGNRIERFILHVSNGGILIFWLMLSVVFVLIARPGRKTVWLTVLSTVMILMQGLYVHSFGQDGIGGGIGIGLHALNGLGVLTVQILVARLAKRSVDDRRAAKARGSEVPA
ncbi:hypothetical protein [Glycomyces salinus]|uniref:hypothetical protein n=1 Tax=Glycomyces salinus TaxID=980294 RepID=UPI0018EE439C|nr:hypothetical protein [Glycomyces salinus]